jgi:2'-5' RNA ligase
MSSEENQNNLFQISADFALDEKPTWLADFRKKYDLPYDYHITFKTTTTFQDQDLDNIKKEIQTIAQNYGPVEIVFDKLFIDSTSHGWYIMLAARPNAVLTKLQKEISQKFSRYGQHTNENNKQFERNFNPHITIGRRLTPPLLTQAKKDLGEDLLCQTTIKSITLTIAREDTFDEWSKPQNRIFYQLGRP